MEGFLDILFLKSPLLSLFVLTKDAHHKTKPFANYTMGSTGRKFIEIDVRARKYIQKIHRTGDFPSGPVVKPMLETRVQSLVWEDPTCSRVTKQAHEPQLLSLRSTTREVIAIRSPCSLQLEKASV